MERTSGRSHCHESQEKKIRQKFDKISKISPFSIGLK
uniref:Uncharacterized protein n=1 Tax=Arundo donax TaxID=35708 RepID=A0A0A9BPT5_ARUDO